MGTREEIRDLYRVRFDPAERAAKSALWRIICGHLQAWFPEKGTVLDLGAGYCEFINNIRAGKKIAVDMNPDTAACAGPDVQVIHAPVLPLPFLETASVDAAFLSNLLEHLADKEQVLALLREVARVLKPGGRMVILMPNIRFAYREYWDFFDHHVALSDRSAAEACRMAGLVPIKVVPAFLPYTTKSRLPQWGILVRTYLALPWLWRLFGKQALVVAEKRAP